MLAELENFFVLVPGWLGILSYTDQPHDTPASIGRVGLEVYTRLPRSMLRVHRRAKIKYWGSLVVDELFRLSDDQRPGHARSLSSQERTRGLQSHVALLQGQARLHVFYAKLRGRCCGVRGRRRVVRLRKVVGYFVIH